MRELPLTQPGRDRRRSSVAACPALVVAVVAGALLAFSASASAAGCFSTPSACGYPDATNAGVPAGTTLTASGSRTLSTAGQVLSGVDLTGDVTVTAPNVTIRDSKIHTNFGGEGTTAIELQNGATNFTLEDSEVYGNGSKTNAPQSGVWNHYNNSGARMVRSYIHGSPDNWEGRIDLVQDSFMKIDATYGGAHSENIYVCGAAVNVDHSTLYNESGETALVYGDGICGRGNIVSITNSLLAGGGYSIEPQAKGVGGGTTVVTGNHFARVVCPERQASWGGWVCDGPVTNPNGYFPRSGNYGHATDLGSNVTWSGNIWDDNGQPVCANGGTGCGGTEPPEEPSPPEEQPDPPAEEPSPPEGTAAPPPGWPSLAEPALSVGQSPVGPGAPAPRVAVHAIWRLPSGARPGRRVVLSGAASKGDGALSCTWTIESKSGSRVYRRHTGCTFGFRIPRTGTRYVRLTVHDRYGNSDSLRRAVSAARQGAIAPSGAHRMHGRLRMAVLPARRAS
jgi:hypothetical protein